MVEKAEVEVKLRRDLGLFEITMIGIGPTIGTTIFVLAGLGARIAGPAILLALVLNFIVTIFTAMAYMELGSAFPETGGGYLWIKDSMPHPLGFLGGWMSWFGHCIVCSVYVLSFGLGIGWLLEAYNVSLGGLSVDILNKIFALLLCIVFIAINYRGTRTTGRWSGRVTITLIIVISIFLVFGFLATFGNSNLSASFSPFFKGANSFQQLTNVLIAMGFTFIVFEGYEIIAQCGEECKEPQKNIPKANWLCIGLSTMIFILVVFVAIGSTSQSFVEKQGEKAIAAASSAVVPRIGLELIVFGVSLGSIAALNSLLFSSSRVSFAMGRDGALPSPLGKLHKVRRTPYVAILTSGFIIMFMVVMLPIETIAASADIMFLLLFLFVNIAVIILRKKRADVKRGYLIPLFPLIPFLGIGTKFILAVSLYEYSPMAWYIAAGWIGLGLVVSYIYAKREEIVEVARVVEAIVPKPEKKYQILLPVADPTNTALVQFGSLLAKVEDADLSLLNIIEVPEALPLDAIDFTYVMEQRHALGKLRKIARDLGVRVTAEVLVSHKVFDSIVETIKERKVDLMILGWTGRWRKGRILGTNIDRFVQYAPCDVVVFKTAGLEEKIKRILVMNAPGWHVSHATGYAILLAKEHGAEITIFSAIQREEEEEKERIYSSRLAEMCKTHGVPYSEKMVRVKSIVEEVLAESEGYDLLVLGATKEWRFRQFAFGAVQDQIARRALCPVLMVRKVRRD